MTAAVPTVVTTTVTAAVTAAVTAPVTTVVTTAVAASSSLPCRRFVVRELAREQVAVVDIPTDTN